LGLREGGKGSYGHPFIKDPKGFGLTLGFTPNPFRVTLKGLGALGVTLHL
jgi:hypothetical protein